MKRPLRSLLALFVCCVLILSACKPVESTPTAVPVAEEPIEVEPTIAAEPEEAVIEESPEESSVEEVVEEAPVEEEPLPELIALVPECEAGSNWVSTVDGARLICIPEGTFMMGALPDDEAAQEDEKPLHEESVSGFWMYENEVTNGMFQLFAESTGYVTTAEELGYSHTLVNGAFVQVLGANWMHPQGPESMIAEKTNEPVVNVSVIDANNYCQWANDGWLPGEQQWEKAARGSEPILYPWGNAAVTTELANYDGEPFETTADIREFEKGASPFNILNMAGNVAEWMQHPYSANAYSTGDFWSGRSSDNVTRGGSWISGEAELRTSDRSPVSMMVDSADNIGFRCVVAALPNPATANNENPPESGCEMIIPAEYNAMVLTNSEEEIFWEYGEWIETETERETTTTRTLWEEKETKIGFFIPGDKTLIQLTYSPCQMLIGSLYKIEEGRHGTSSSVYFEFYKDVTVTKTVDGSAIFYLREGSDVVQNSDGSLTVFVAGAKCSADGKVGGSSESQMPTVEEVSGKGVASVEQTDNGDGTQTLKFWLQDGEYPDGYDEWMDSLMMAMPIVSSLGSSFSESDGVYSDVMFEITVPTDSEVMLEDGLLTITFVP